MDTKRDVAVVIPWAVEIDKENWQNGKTYES